MNKPKNIPEQIDKYKVTEYLRSGSYGHGLVSVTPEGKEVFNLRSNERPSALQRSTGKD